MIEKIYKQQKQKETLHTEEQRIPKDNSSEIFQVRGQWTKYWKKKIAGPDLYPLKIAINNKSELKTFFSQNKQRLRKFTVTIVVECKML